MSTKTRRVHCPRCNVISEIAADGEPHALRCCGRSVAIPPDAPGESHYTEWVPVPEERTDG